METITSINEMKAFLKEHPFTPEMLQRILKRFDLENVNLEAEHIKISEKSSNLSARQRKAVEELILLKNAMDELDKEKEVTQKVQDTASFSTN